LCRQKKVTKEKLPATFCPVNGSALAWLSTTPGIPDAVRKGYSQLVISSL
jgi:hypothetical protein